MGDLMKQADSSYSRGVMLFQMIGGATTETVVLCVGIALAIQPTLLRRIEPNYQPSPDDSLRFLLFSVFALVPTYGVAIWVYFRHFRNRR